MGKKQELLELSANIIREDGMNKLTMDYLAKKAGITKGGVLYHFESKEVLLQKMNEMAIEDFEKRIEKYMVNLRGNYKFTRAYALATLEYLDNPTDAQLSAVFISSLEYKDNFKLWQKVIQDWKKSLALDGDSNQVLELRLLSDGIWFAIIYDQEEIVDKKEEMKKLVLAVCASLDKEEK